jgi:hypothetical protein
MGFFFLFFYSWRGEVGMDFTFSLFVNFFSSLKRERGHESF